MKQPKNRGHKPRLLGRVSGLVLQEVCELCKDEKKRGEKWERWCPHRAGADGEKTKDGT